MLFDQIAAVVNAGALCPNGDVSKYAYLAIISQAGSGHLSRVKPTVSALELKSPYFVQHWFFAFSALTRLVWWPEGIRPTTASTSGLFSVAIWSRIFRRILHFPFPGPAFVPGLSNTHVFRILEACTGSGLAGIPRVWGSTAKVTWHVVGFVRSGLRMTLLNSTELKFATDDNYTGPCVW